MDEGKFAADFVSANLEKIIEFGKGAYGKVDAALQVHLKTAYTDYLNASRLKYSKSKSFFIRDQPVELHFYYVPTGISCGQKLINKPDLKQCLDFTNRIVISGTGGSGKSVLMKHLFLDCIQEKSHIPILIELRDLNSYDKKLDDFVNETLENFGFKTTENYVSNAKKSGHFCYIFDGLDEVTPTLRKKISNQISALSKKFSKCPIFISSRPDDDLTALEYFSIFQMLPLNLSDAIELVTRLPFDEVIKNKFCGNLRDGLFEKHKSFLSNPLLLSIMLLTYGENAEIPAKLSIFYNQAYEALFRRHDAYKGAFNRDRLSKLDVMDFAKIFSVFCLQTYDKRLMKMPRSTCLEYIKKSSVVSSIEINPNDYLSDLLCAVCLMVEDGLEITFAHRSFQEYFVALYLSTATPENQLKLIDRFWLNRYDNVMKLLKEINIDLYERALLIRKMEVMFNNLKIVKSIGITHYVRYLKYFFSEIDYRDDGTIEGVSFTFNGSKNDQIVCEHELLKILVNEYSSWAHYSDEVTKNHKDEMYNKYFKGGHIYKTKQLTIKSPIVKDLNSDGGYFSIHYITAAFEGFKRLKAKHVNTPQSFEALLGIN